MQLFLLVLHIIITIAIIAAILFQKGEEINASTSNPYNNMFSGRGGSGNDMTKITAILAAMFFSSCLLMAIWVKKEAQLTQYVKPKEKVIPSDFFDKQDPQSNPTEAKSDHDPKVSGGLAKETSSAHSQKTSQSSAEVSKKTIPAPASVKEESKNGQKQSQSQSDKKPAQSKETAKLSGKNVVSAKSKKEPIAKGAKKGKK